MPVRREDGITDDYCQIGNHPGPYKERYISHLDTYGTVTWSKINQSEVWRPLKYFYVIG